MTNLLLDLLHKLVTYVHAFHKVDHILIVQKIPEVVEKHSVHLETHRYRAKLTL